MLNWTLQYIAVPICWTLIGLRVGNISIRRRKLASKREGLVSAGQWVVTDRDAPVRLGGVSGYHERVLRISKQQLISKLPLMKPAWPCRLVGHSKRLLTRLRSASGNANPRRWAVEAGWQSCRGEWKRAWMSSVRTLNAASVFQSRVETKIKSHCRPVGLQNHLTTQTFLWKEASRWSSLRFQKTFLKITSVWIKHSCAK